MGQIPQLPPILIRNKETRATDLIVKNSANVQWEVLNNLIGLAA